MKEEIIRIINEVEDETILKFIYTYLKKVKRKHN